MQTTNAELFRAAHRTTRNMRAFLWTSTPYREVFAMALRQVREELAHAARQAAAIAKWAAQFATKDLPARIRSAAEAARDFAGCRDADTRARAARELNALRAEAAARGLA